MMVDVDLFLSNFEQNSLKPLLIYITCVPIGKTCFMLRRILSKLNYYKDPLPNLKYVDLSNDDSSTERRT